MFTLWAPIGSKVAHHGHWSEVVDLACMFEVPK